MSFNLGSVIKTVAPFLADALVPGSGFVISAASSLISAIGGDVVAPLQQAVASGDEKSIISTIGDMFQKGDISTAQIKQAEASHAERMAELGFKNVADLEALANADRASARGRDAEITKDGKHNYRADILAYLAIGAMGFCGYAFATMEIPAANREMLVVLVGALVVIVKDIYGFEFSTTRDSQGKTETISKIAKAT